jgi:Protein of unknown function (DUF1153)
MGQFQPVMTMRLVSSQAERFTIASLPPAHSRHWIPRHKRAVVAAVHSGMLPLREAMERYDMSMEEFVSWESEFAQRPTEQREEAYA